MVMEASMYGSNAWLAGSAGNLTNSSISLDLVPALIVAASTPIFVAAVLVLWASGRNENYGTHTPLTAIVATLIALGMAHIAAVPNAVPVSFAISAAFLLNGKLKPALVFCFGTLLNGAATVLINDGAAGGLVFGAIMGVLSALASHFIFAALILAAFFWHDMRKDG
jgi:hypothetical protein